MDYNTKCNIKEHNNYIFQFSQCSEFIFYSYDLNGNYGNIGESKYMMVPLSFNNTIFIVHNSGLKRRLITVCPYYEI